MRVRCSPVERGKEVAASAELVDGRFRADQAPELRQVIADAQEQGLDCLLLDGTLIATDHVNEAHRKVDRWYSGKHKHHGGNVQVIAGPDG